jgi:hypothetical protein
MDLIFKPDEARRVAKLTERISAFRESLKTLEAEKKLIRDRARVRAKAQAKKETQCP